MLVYKIDRKTSHLRVLQTLSYRSYVGTPSVNGSKGESYIKEKTNG